MKVAVVTGSRADYGLLSPTLCALRDDARFDMCLLATAMHLDPEYGETLAQIEADGHAITALVAAGARVHRREDFARNLGCATVAFSETLAACAPDLLLVLGDRFESLAAALAATGQGIPIAHMHGGELSEGSLDDSLRHCVTKLSHLHFVATRSHAERVCQLGEDPSRIHVVGAAGPESIRALALLDRAQLADALELGDLPTPLLALTLHPASLDPERAGIHAAALTSAVDEVLQGEGCVIVTLPNDDPGSTSVREHLLAWARARENVHTYATLGQRRYLSLLGNADAVLGNSSSAIIEAPSLRVPVVNVGERQRGRLTAENVLSCEATLPAIVAALRRALDPAFRGSLGDLENPYDQGDVSARVVEILSAAALADLLHKRFFDLPDAPWRVHLSLPRAPGMRDDGSPVCIRGPAREPFGHRKQRRPDHATKLVVAGAGGHARSVLDALRASHAPFTPVACTDPDPALRGEVLAGVPIAGDDEILPALLVDGVRAACVGVGGIGDNRPRAALHARLVRLGFELPAVVHGSAQVSCTATVGRGSVVLAGAMVGTGTTVGEDVIVGSGSIVEHDCSIGDHVHLASGCVLGGAVAIAQGAHVGLGATVLQGRAVGEWAVVGAGAVVVHDVLAGETVVGCPASVRDGAAR